MAYNDLLSGGPQPAPPVFTPIELSQRDRVEAIRTASGSALYGYTFVSLFTWQEYEDYSVCIRDDAFLVKNAAAGDDAYLFPCGTKRGKKEFIDALTASGAPVFSFITDGDRRFLEEEYPGMFLFEDCRDEYSYIYDVEEQIAMRGREFKNLRHHVHSGRAAAQDWTTEPLSPGNIGRAAELTRLWARGLKPGDPADTAPAEKALRCFSELGLLGFIFQADGKDMAFVAGCFITPDTFDTSFCKVLDRSCDCFIRWSLYNALPPEVKKVDSEDDMGIPGLRTHKLMRRPSELIRVWKGSFIK